MKTYPVLNLAPRQEDVWRIGGIAPCVLNLGARWNSQLHVPIALPLGKSPRYQSIAKIALGKYVHFKMKHVFAPPR